MNGFEYGNARLHAMKARLLSRRELESMIQAGSLQGLIAELTKTSYRPSIESALARTTGLDCVTEALHFDQANTLAKLRSFYRQEPGKLVALLLQAYDIHNLKTILRGLNRNAPASEILPALIPVGELKYALLVELVNARDARAAVDLVASTLQPVARPLLRLQGLHPGAPEYKMELALDRWYLSESRKQLTQKKNKAKKLLVALLDLDADLVNILTVLRFAHAPTERDRLAEHVKGEGIHSLFIGPGRLSFTLLERAARQDSVSAAVTILAGTTYQAVLQSGLDRYNRLGRLSAMERDLRRYRLDWLVPLIQKDPLGIGVVLGYMALKINEIQNLSWIAHGVNLALNPEAIRLEVEWVG